MKKSKPRIIGLHGAPRSGTSWIGQIFNSSKSVAYRYQPFFSYAFRGRVTEDSGYAELQAFFDDLLVTRDDFILQKGGENLGPKEEHFSKTGVTHLVYKEVRFHHLLPVLLEKLDGFRAIGLVRDPRAVLWSWSRAPREFEAGWSLSGEWRHAQAKNRGLEENWYGFERWKELALLFMDLSRRYPERFRVFRYEDFLADVYGQVASAFEFCGLEMAEQTEDFIKRSTSSNDGDPYGVYRQHGRLPEMPWRDGLDPGICEAVTKDLTGTPLERYLR